MKRIVALFVKIAFFAIILSGCEIKYKPVGNFPIGVVYNTQTGLVEIQGELELVTFIGNFEFSTTYTKDFLGDGDFILILRDRKFNVDKVYAIHSGSDEKVDVVVSGRARITFEDGGAIVDVLDGEIVNVSFRSVSKEDISWANAPCNYRPFKYTKTTFLSANALVQHPGFVWICPSFFVGAILFVLLIPVFIFDLFFTIIVGIGLLLGPFGVRNVYYVILVITPVFFVMRRLLFE